MNEWKYVAHRPFLSCRIDFYISFYVHIVKRGFSLPTNLFN